MQNKEHEHYAKKYNLPTKMLQKQSKAWWTNENSAFIRYWLSGWVTD